MGPPVPVTATVHAPTRVATAPLRLRAADSQACSVRFTMFSCLCRLSVWLSAAASRLTYTRARIADSSRPPRPPRRGEPSAPRARRRPALSEGVRSSIRWGPGGGPSAPTRGRRRPACWARRTGERRYRPWRCTRRSPWRSPRASPTAVRPPTPPPPPQRADLKRRDLDAVGGIEVRAEAGGLVCCARLRAANSSLQPPPVEMSTRAAERATATIASRARQRVGT
eukprot:1183791-Prorocentrum_minimum.AAC.1